MPRRPQPLRIAIDTGGTFTDCVWIDAGRLRMLKVFSTPADPSQAIVEALRKVAHEGELVLLHGTTVGTNTLLERKGARTALVTTKGFEDAIEIGRQARPKLYDFFFDRIEPLVAKDRRFGAAETEKRCRRRAPLGCRPRRRGRAALQRREERQDGRAGSERGEKHSRGRTALQGREKPWHEHGFSPCVAPSAGSRKPEAGSLPPSHLRHAI